MRRPRAAQRSRAHDGRAPNPLRRRAEQRVEWTDPGAGLWGVISDLDLVRLVATDALAGRTAGQSAATPAFVVGERDSVQEAARLMADNDVTHLVVVNHAARPVGVLSTLDVAQAVSDAVHVPR